MRGRTTLLGTLGAMVIMAGGAGAGYGVHKWRSGDAARPQPAPSAAVVFEGPSADHAQPEASPPPSSPAPLPPSVYIKVPYTSQSPFGKWARDDPHEHYCEAAAVYMVGLYFKGDRRDRIPAAEADAAMGQIVGYERTTWPGVLDLNLGQIGAVGGRFYGLEASVEPVDLDRIKAHLAEGRPVVIPVMTHGAPGGRKIAPNYGATNVYHVMPLIGYDAPRDLVYANDPGYTQGQNHAYSWSVLSAAIDAQAGRFPHGRSMLVFRTRQ